MPHVTDEDISTYVDGRLEPGRYDEVVREIERNPSLRHKAEAFASQGEALHELFDDVLDEPVPDRLMQVVRPTVANQNKPSGGFSFSQPRQWLAAAAVAGLVFTGGLGSGWMLKDGGNQENAIFAPLVRESVLSHQMMELNRPSGAVAGQAAITMNGDANPFQVALRAPSQAGSSNFQPVSFRNVVGSSGETVQVLYSDEQGEVVTLYVQEHSKNVGLPFEKSTVDGYNVVYWMDGPLLYSLVSQKDSNSLMGLANAFYASKGIQPLGQQQMGGQPVMGQQPSASQPSGLQPVVTQPAGQVIPTQPGTQ